MFIQGDFQIRSQSYYAIKRHSSEIPTAPGGQASAVSEEMCLLQQTTAAELNS